MKPFEESDRYNYPELTPDSIVLDCGGYEGNWGAEIKRRYKCTVVVLEPVLEFAARIQANHPELKVHPCGIAGSTRFIQMGVHGDSSGALGDLSHQCAVCLALDVRTVMECALGVFNCSLIKLNIEGMEFEVLETILDAGKIKWFHNLQIQFHHKQVDHKERREAIRTRLAETHTLTYDEPWVWENWKIQS